jgi:hypothetical protein
MKVSSVSSDEIINMTKSFDDDGIKIQSDFLIRAINITNDGSKRCKIERIRFNLYHDNELLQTLSYPANIIKQRADMLFPLIDPFTQNPDNELSLLGSTNFWKGEFVNSTELEPGQVTGFTHEHIISINEKKVSAVEIEVVYIEEDKELTTCTRTRVSRYENKNSYIFPFKGIWLVVNNWDEYPGHRTSVSQEFAIDIIRHDSEGLFPLDKPNEYYEFYREEIMAIADGVVVRVFDEIPENPRAGEKYEIDVLNIYKTYGMRAITAGNYIIIEHENGEYSFYAHLVKGEMRVKVGESVKQGQVIGLLGNSGNSDAPHLHLALLDSAELGASSLPIQFRNITDTFGKDISCIEQSYSTIFAH